MQVKKREKEGGTEISCEEARYTGKKTQRTKKTRE